LLDRCKRSAKIRRIKKKNGRGGRGRSCCHAIMAPATWKLGISPFIVDDSPAKPCNTQEAKEVCELAGTCARLYIRACIYLYTSGCACFIRPSRLPTARAGTAFAAGDHRPLMSGQRSRGADAAFPMGVVVSGSQQCLCRNMWGVTCSALEGFRNRAGTKCRRIIQWG
jgi:hypothetical protein